MLEVSRKGFQITRDEFHYDWVFGGFCTWMLTLSSFMLAYYVFKQPSATKTPFIYWAVLSWTITPLWLVSWGIWIANLIFDNHGGKIHIILAVTSIVYMVLPVIIQPIFLLIILIAYIWLPIYRTDDPNFLWFWIVLILSDLANFFVYYYTASGI